MIALICFVLVVLASPFKIGIAALHSLPKVTLNPPFDKFLTLGGRSEEISQICVVRGKAVAASRNQNYDFARHPSIFFDRLLALRVVFARDSGDTRRGRPRTDRPAPRRHSGRVG